MQEQEHVYVLTHPRIPGLVKIGCAKDPTRRLVEINSATGVPGAYSVNHLVRCDRAQPVESAVHQALSAFRYSKEFFNVPVSVAVEACERAAAGEVFGAQIKPDPNSIRISSPASLGYAIRLRRRRAKLTQAQLAEAAGCGRRAIIDLESGKATGQIGVAFQALRALGVSLAALEAERCSETPDMLDEVEGANAKESAHA